MKKELKDFLVGISVLLLYLLSSFIFLIILNILHINPSNFNMVQKIIYNLSFEFILLGIIMLIYRKDGRTIADRFVYTKVIRNN